MGSSGYTRGVHEEETVDLLDYAKRLTRFVVPAGIVALVVMVIAVAFGFAAKPQYHMKAHVLVRPGKVVDQERSPAEADMLSRTMRTFVALADLPQLTEEAAKHTQGKYDSKQVAAMTDIFWGGGSFLLAIQATASTEEDSKMLSNAMADALVKLGPDLLKGDSEGTPHMAVVEKAKQDEEMPAPKTRMDAIIPGAAAGIVAGVLVAMVLEYRSSRRQRKQLSAEAGPVGTGSGAPRDPS